jgi:sirohydrochlorin cobaltochelatase
MHYLAASAEFQRLDKNVFMATVEGVPDFAEIHKELLKRNIKKVWLMPFMIVAGDHACNDLAGEDKDSWKAQLEADNIECCAILKGLGEYNSIAKLFINQ